MKHIYLNGKQLENKEYIGKNIFYIMEDGSRITNTEIELVETKCPDCNEKRTLKKLHHYNLNKETVCAICRSMGENNPFYGKTHTEEFKKKLSEDRKGKRLRLDSRSVYQCWLDKYGEGEANLRMIARSEKQSKSISGKNNPFYGKTHSEETKQRLAITTKAMWDNFTDEEYKIMIDNLTKGQHRYREENPIKFLEAKKKAAKASILSQNRYQKNNPETIVGEELNSRKLNFSYSTILNFMQFDFGNKEKYILLEVHGDYWHGNPKLYKSENLNDIQLSNQRRDKEKYDWAISKGFHIYYIWEQDINNDDFSIIDEIEREHF